MSQPDFKHRIDALSDVDAIRVMAFIADDLRTELRLGQQIDLGVGTDLNDDTASQVMAEAIPAYAKELNQTALSAPEAERGEVARRVLHFLVTDRDFAPVYAPRVEAAIRQRYLVVDPITALAVGGGLLFLLTIRFKIESKVVDGQRQRVWKVERDPSTIEELKLLFGKGGDFLGKIFGGKSSEFPRDEDRK
jgi:hypothetical protein